MSIDLGSPPVRIILSNINYIQIGHDLVPISELIRHLNDYINASSQTFKSFVISQLSKATRVQGGGIMIPYLGIDHWGWRLYLPPATPPRVIQPTFKFYCLECSPHELYELLVYFLTKMNMFENDPRISFIQEFVHDFIFDVDAKPPDLSDVLREDKPLGEAFGMIPLHLKLGFLSIFLFLHLGYYSLHYFELTKDSSTLSVITIVMTLSVLAVVGLFQLRFQKGIYAKHFADILRENSALECHEKSESGTFNDCWSIQIKIDENHEKSPRDIAHSMFGCAAFMGFRWIHFEIDGLIIRGVIAPQVELVIHKWGYLYPAESDLGVEGTKRLVSGDELGPYVNQIGNRILTRIFSQLGEVKMSISCISKFVVKVATTIDSDKYLNREDLVSSVIDRQIDSFMNSEIHPKIEQDFSKMKPWTIHSMGRSYHFIGPIWDWIEHIKNSRIYFFYDFQYDDHDHENTH